MEEESAKNPEFKKSAVKILKANSNLLIFTRYLASKEYHHIKSEREFDDFLAERKSKECLTLFRNKFSIVKNGVVDYKFIKETIERIAQEKHVDWVAVGRIENNDQYDKPLYQIIVDYSSAMIPYSVDLAIIL